MSSTWLLVKRFDAWVVAPSEREHALDDEAIERIRLGMRAVEEDLSDLLPEGYSVKFQEVEE